MSYDRSVFINCPFDVGYKALFDALIFAVLACQFEAHCSLEISNSGEPRITKLQKLIGACRYGLHDLSCTELTSEGLPRFNMPLELGLFLGAMHHGDELQRQKVCLVLDREDYRYQRFCSDIAGQDIKAHGGEVRKAIEEVRNWLSTAESERGAVIDGGAYIFERYQEFLSDLPGICAELNWDRGNLLFTDFRAAAKVWLGAR